MSLINGRAYEHSTLKIDLLGGSIDDCTALSYGVNRDPVYNHGNGELPVSYSMGNKKCEGSITLEVATVEAIQRSLPAGKTLTDIRPFTISVTYQDDDNLMKNHILQNCMFKSNKRDTTVDGGRMVVQLDLAIANIIW